MVSKEKIQTSLEALNRICNSVLLFKGAKTNYDTDFCFEIKENENLQLRIDVFNKKEKLEIYVIKKTTKNGILKSEFTLKEKVFDERLLNVSSQSSLIEKQSKLFFVDTNYVSTTVYYEKHAETSTDKRDTDGLDNIYKQFQLVKQNNGSLRIILNFKVDEFCSKIIPILILQNPHYFENLLLKLNSCMITLEIFRLSSDKNRLVQNLFDNHSMIFDDILKNSTFIDEMIGWLFYIPRNVEYITELLSKLTYRILEVIFECFMLLGRLTENFKIVFAKIVCSKHINDFFENKSNIECSFQESQSIEECMYKTYQSIGEGSCCFCENNSVLKHFFISIFRISIGNYDLIEHFTANFANFYEYINSMREQISLEHKNKHLKKPLSQEIGSNFNNKSENASIHDVTSHKLISLEEVENNSEIGEVCSSHENLFNTTQKDASSFKIEGNVSSKVHTKIKQNSVESSRNRLIENVKHPQNHLTIFHQYGKYEIKNHNIFYSIYEMFDFISEIHHRIGFLSDKDKLNHLIKTINSRNDFPTNDVVQNLKGILENMLQIKKKQNGNVNINQIISKIVVPSNSYALLSNPIFFEKLKKYKRPQTSSDFDFKTKIDDENFLDHLNIPEFLEKVSEQELSWLLNIQNLEISKFVFSHFNAINIQKKLECFYQSLFPRFSDLLTSFLTEFVADLFEDVNISFFNLMIAFFCEKYKIKLEKCNAQNDFKNVFAESFNLSNSLKTTIKEKYPNNHEQLKVKDKKEKDDFYIIKQIMGRFTNVMKIFEKSKYFLAQNPKKGSKLLLKQIILTQKIDDQNIFDTMNFLTKQFKKLSLSNYKSISLSFKNIPHTILFEKICTELLKGENLFTVFSHMINELPNDTLHMLYFDFLVLTICILEQNTEFYQYLFTNKFTTSILYSDKIFSIGNHEKEKNASIPLEFISKKVKLVDDTSSFQKQFFYEYDHVFIKFFVQCFLTTKKSNINSRFLPLQVFLKHKIQIKDFRCVYLLEYFIQSNMIQINLDSSFNDVFRSTYFDLERKFGIADRLYELHLKSLDNRSEFAKKDFLEKCCTNFLSENWNDIKISYLLDSEIKFISKHLTDQKFDDIVKFLKTLFSDDMQTIKNKNSSDNIISGGFYANENILNSPAESKNQKGIKQNIIKDNINKSSLKNPVKNNEYSSKNTKILSMVSDIQKLGKNLVTHKNDNFLKLRSLNSVIMICKYKEDYFSSDFLEFLHNLQIKSMSLKIQSCIHILETRKNNRERISQSFLNKDKNTINEMSFQNIQKIHENSQKRSKNFQKLDTQTFKVEPNKCIKYFDFNELNSTLGSYKQEKGQNISNKTIMNKNKDDNRTKDASYDEDLNLRNLNKTGDDIKSYKKEYDTHTNAIKMNETTNQKIVHQKSRDEILEERKKRFKTKK